MVAELSSLAAFHDELKKPGTLVLDFYSPSCGPCHVVAPLYENLSEEEANQQVRFFKVNGLDKEGSQIQKAAEVIWWPTFVIYHEGQEQWRGKVPNPPDQHPISALTAALAKVREEKNSV